MKKKILTIALSVAMVSTMSLSAFASDYQEATSPAGSPYDDKFVTSLGKSTITSSDGIKFSTENDDDGIGKETDVNGSDTYVWASVIEKSDPVYKVDIMWGAMIFQFSRHLGTWDPETHQYTISKYPQWDKTYVDGTNNILSIFNHSNDKIKASFKYKVGTPNIFNKTDGPNNVIGLFYPRNTPEGHIAGAVDGSNILTGTDRYSHGAHGANGVIEYLEIESAEGTESYNPPMGNAFFTLAGTPDEDSLVTELTKSGVITVTIAPYVAPEPF